MTGQLSLDSFEQTFEKTKIKEECKHCCKTNIPHELHWRHCEMCEKKQYFSFAHWKSDQHVRQVSCSFCGALGEIIGKG